MEEGVPFPLPFHSPCFFREDATTYVILSLPRFSSRRIRRGLEPFSPSFLHLICRFFPPHHAGNHLLSDSGKRGPLALFFSLSPFGLGSRGRCFFSLSFSHPVGLRASQGEKRRKTGFCARVPKGCESWKESFFAGTCRIRGTHGICVLDMVRKEGGQRRMSEGVSKAISVVDTSFLAASLSLFSPFPLSRTVTRKV